MRAIILDGHLKSALCTVRSLGRKKVEFSVGAERNTAMALHSVYTKETFVYTSPLADKDTFIDELEKEAKRLGEKPLLYAFSDATAVAIIRHRERLEHVATILMPENEQIELAFDKSKTLELAKKLDIKIPTTHALTDLDDIAQLSKELTYPAIVKPRRSAYWRDGKGYNGTVVIEHTPADLTAYVAKKFIESGEMPLIQRCIKGDEYGVELIAEQGDVRSVCIHKRIRSLSPSGGASVVKETVGESGLTTIMKDNAVKLAQHMLWHGVMMVEFKIDDRVGEPVLMEINGRFWGSLPLALFADIDFPYMYFELAQGKHISSVTQKDGVVSRHLLGDVRYMLHVLFSRDPMRQMLYPTRSHAIRSFLRFRNMRYDVIQKNDIKPFLMEIIDVVKKALP